MGSGARAASEPPAVMRLRALARGARACSARAGAAAASERPHAAATLRALARGARACSSARAAPAHASATSGGAQLLAALRGRQLAVTMEHSGTSVPWHVAAPAWASLRGLLAASVHTDLPQAPGAVPLPVALGEVPLAVRQQLPRAAVQAVGAHARAPDALEARMRAASACGAAALLLVSGDASSRAAAGGGACASAAPALLRTALRLRAAGALAPDTALCVAANPLTEAAAALLPKLDAGAEAVLTQPALLLGRASRWWDAASAPGGALARHAGATPVLLGVALPSCERDVALWLRLADVPASDADAAALLSAWRAAAARGADALAAHAAAAAQAALQHAASLPGVGGVHLMPLSRGGYALAASPEIVAALRRMTTPLGSTPCSG
jgi:5,10-methylenetetrahydrofolate reductase